MKFVKRLFWTSATAIAAQMLASSPSLGSEPPRPCALQISKYFSGQIQLLNVFQCFSEKIASLEERAPKLNFSPAKGKPSRSGNFLLGQVNYGPSYQMAEVSLPTSTFSFGAPSYATSSPVYAARSVNPQLVHQAWQVGIAPASAPSYLANQVQTPLEIVGSPVQPLGDAQIDLGEFLTPEVTRSTWAKIYHEHSHILSGKGLQVFGVLENGRQKYHLRVGPYYSNAEAVQVCNSLRSRGQFCKLPIR